MNHYKSLKDALHVVKTRVELLEDALAQDEVLGSFTGEDLVADRAALDRARIMHDEVKAMVDNGAPGDAGTVAQKYDDECTAARQALHVQEVSGGATQQHITLMNAVILETEVIARLLSALCHGPFVGDPCEVAHHRWSRDVSDRLAA